MATIIKRGPYQYQAKIRRKGYPTQIKTFELKREALEWSSNIESEMNRGTFQDRTGLERTLLSHVLQDYLDNEAPHKKSFTSISYRVKSWLNHPLANRTLASLSTIDFMDWANERLETVNSSTARRDLMEVASSFSRARTHLNLPINKSILEPVLAQLKPGQARERRLGKDEEVLLLKYATEYSKEAVACIQLAIETGMRRGEICQLQWQNVSLVKKEECITLSSDITKNGKSRVVPLSLKAVNILKSLNPCTTGRVFISFKQPDSISQFFDRICKRAKIEDFCFHDLRHEAASRIAPYVPTASLAKIMGWSSIQMAMRYYNPTAGDLIKIIRDIPQSP